MRTFAFISQLFQSRNFPIDNIWRSDDLINHRQELAQKWLRGSGLEIGALHEPVMTGPDVKVTYVDYKSYEQNRERYPELDSSRIVKTDLVDDGFILGKVDNESQDFIIANHALEHSPDALGTLINWFKKLKSGGILYFAIPIAEKCYDNGRAITDLHHFINEHKSFSSIQVDQILTSTREHLVEFMTISDATIRQQNNVLPLLTEQEIQERATSLMEPLSQALTEIRPSEEDLIMAHVSKLNMVYDLHYHTFTPISFYQLVHYFAENYGGKLEQIQKSANIECIAVVRKS